MEPYAPSNQYKIGLCLQLGRGFWFLGIRFEFFLFYILGSVLFFLFLPLLDFLLFSAVCFFALAPHFLARLALNAIAGFGRFVASIIEFVKRFKLSATGASLEGNFFCFCIALYPQNSGSFSNFLGDYFFH